MRPLLVRAAAACLLVVPLGLAGLAPASAHDEILSTSPKDGASLEAPPAEIVLTFGEEVEDIGAAVVVTDSAGQKLATGKPVVKGVTVTQAVAPATAAGKVKVAWRVVSSDGHPVSGTFSFTVTTAASASPTPSPSASSSSPAASPSASSSSPAAASSTAPAPEPSTTLAGDTDTSTSSSPLPWILGGLLVIAVGVAVALGLRGRGGSSA
ncbi:MAG: copper resistance protein CopC [Actinobacteria bacterium]|nr:copper resistance protein CopC [Actinomycetota bacterium]